MLAISVRSVLKQTTTKCPTCQRLVPGEVVRQSAGNGHGSPDTVLLVRTCPEHGRFETCLASDARFYWLSKGASSCCGGEPCAEPADAQGHTGTLGGNAMSTDTGECEKLSTCLALIEIVHSCNLACPTCYADSPVGAAGASLQAEPLDDLKRRIDAVVERKGRIEILQLSGGEPTLHPQFIELFAWCQAHPKIDYTLINTNGVRIVRDRDFFKALAKTFIYGKCQLYLQYDGPDVAGQLTLRGLDLRENRKNAVALCAGVRLPVTLAMTVTDENVSTLWASILDAIQFSHVRGITFQPMFRSGRSVPPLPGAPEPRRLNVADIITACIGQSDGLLSSADFTPLPCGDPNCSTIGYLLRTPQGIRSVSEFIDFSAVQGFLRDRVRYSLSDLERCGCESEPLGELLHALEVNETSTFRIFIKPFMDAWTWDEDRIDRCCTHVIRPDGKLDSFCRYYASGGRLGVIA